MLIFERCGKGTVYGMEFEIRYDHAVEVKATVRGQSGTGGVMEIS